MDFGGGCRTDKSGLTSEGQRFYYVGRIMSIRRIIASKWVRVVGMVLMVIGFILRNIDYHPKFLRIIAPQYSRGKNALEKVAANGVLLPGDDGFDVISNLVIQKLYVWNPKKHFPDDMIVDKMWHGASIEELGEMKASNLQVKISSKTTRITFSNGGNDMAFSMSEFSNSLEEQKRKNVYTASEWAFFLGLFIDAASFLAMPKKSDVAIPTPTQPPQEPTHQQSGEAEHQENIDIGPTERDKTDGPSQKEEGDDSSPK
jgi:hypothetical protein